MASFQVYEAGPFGQAAVYTLEDVDRTDHPAGANPGGPGKPAAAFLTLGDRRDDVSFESKVAHSGSPFILYSTESRDGAVSAETVLVFLEFADKPALWAEAFLDRGARSLVARGSRVAVVSLATAEEWVAARAAAAALTEGRVSFVWNCGRCGSTLMHKALEAVGVASSSEPHWCDQLGSRATRLTSAELSRALAVCLPLELALCCKPDTARFSINPKNIAGGAPLAACVEALYPRCQHVFMYRSCERVCDSFGKLLHAGQSAEHCADERGAGERAWSAVPAEERVRGLPTLPLYSKTVERAALCGALPWHRASRAAVAVELSKWFDAMAPWLELRALRASQGRTAAEDAVLNAPAIRMDEFVGASKRRVVQQALVHLEVLQRDDDAALDAAMRVFETHSQAGSAMAAKSSAPFLTADDRVLARECVEKAESVLGLPLFSRDAGENCLIPGSLGVDL